ncbi:XseA, Exonuclease VII, large subunit [gamma proteobacterium HdN1]|nr:XseA, Exonuclease VII, large subunit [gamma proteobacterium HdN1]
MDEGRDIAPFSRWLPDGVSAPASTSRPADPELQFFGTRSDPEGSALVASAQPTGLATREQALSAAKAKGVSLSQLLGGVSTVIARQFGEGVWTLVEVVQVQARGHVYLELSERDAQGQPIAKAKGMIWSATAKKILPVFERETGMVLGAGIKLLVRARPVFHAQYGFSVEIDEIDASFTLGDLEARKREIRERLQREGVFERNRQLAAPWDYYRILVIAPNEAAGLGDFRKEADRLARFGLCEFSYAYSRFQGEGAAQEIVAALTKAFATYPKNAPPDAIALIRGGGAVNDLAWLNDYDLARCICDLPVPVLTGIGHERDNTLPDEVANQRFDTPSKVVAHIQTLIVQRAQAARDAGGFVFSAVAAQVQTANLETQRAIMELRHNAQAQLSEAKLSVPRLQQEITASARENLMLAQSKTELGWQAVKQSSLANVRAARQACEESRSRVAERADVQLKSAQQQAIALMREITGQGPEKTLARGFVIVRAGDQKPVTSLSHAQSLDRFNVQFKDGVLPVVKESK